MLCSSHHGTARNDIGKQVKRDTRPDTLTPYSYLVPLPVATAERAFGATGATSRHRNATPRRATPRAKALLRPSHDTPKPGGRNTTSEKQRKKNERHTYVMR